MKYWRTQLDADRISVPQGDVHIVVERCKGCAFCVEYCPRDVLAMSTGGRIHARSGGLSAEEIKGEDGPT